MNKKDWEFIYMMAIEGFMSISCTVCSILASSTGNWLGIICSIYIMAYLAARTFRRYGNE